MRFRVSFDYVPYLCILVALIVCYLLFQPSFLTTPKLFGGADDQDNQSTKTELPASMLPDSMSEDEISNPNLKNDTIKVIEVPKKVSCEAHSDCNVIYGKGENRCMKGKCQCRSGEGTFCHQRPTYYKDPKDMTPPQIIKFKNKANLEKMTLEDYRNWLSLFKYDVENLPKMHLRNFYNYMQGQPVYDIPMPDFVDEFFADKASKRDRVCMDIPNAEIDSPLNWKMHSQLNNSGEGYVSGSGGAGYGKDYLQYSKYYNHPFMSKSKYEINNHGVTVKDWFMNNINWLFYDVDRNSNYRDPNKNRFLNIVEPKPQPKFEAQTLLSKSGVNQTKENTVAPNSDAVNMLSEYEINPPNPIGQPSA